MKRILLSLIAAVAFGCNISAQDYVYLIKNDTVVAKLEADSVDYMSFTLPEGVVDPTAESAEIDLTPVCFNQSDQSVAFTFPCVLAWDDTGRFRINHDSGIDFSSLNLTAGESQLRIYKTGTGQAQINDANWSSFYILSDWVGDQDVLQDYLTQDMIDWLLGTQTDGWSNTAWIIQGDGLTVSKITLLP